MLQQQEQRQPTFLKKNKKNVHKFLFRIFLFFLLPIVLKCFDFLAFGEPNNFLALSVEFLESFEFGFLFRLFFFEQHDF